MAQALKTNRLIPILASVFVAMAASVFFIVKKDEKGAQRVVADSGRFMSRAPIPKTADADTPNDTIRALRGQYEKMNARLSSVTQLNESLKQQRDDAEDTVTDMQARYQTMLDETLQQQQETLALQREAHEEKMDVLLNKLNHVMNQRIERDAASLISAQQIDELSKDASALPAGFGFGVQSGEFISGEKMIDVFWIEPLDESINHRQQLSVSTDAVTKDSVQSRLLTPLTPAKNLVHKTLSVVGAAK